MPLSAPAQAAALHVSVQARLRCELQQLVPSESKLGVSSAENPILAAWHGASIFAAADDYAAQIVTKEQYREGGHAYCRRKFLAA